MKNKKFLLTIAMIMSLVMAVSCGDTPTDSTGGNGGGAGAGGGSGTGGTGGGSEQPIVSTTQEEMSTFIKLLKDVSVDIKGGSAGDSKKLKFAFATKNAVKNSNTFKVEEVKGESAGADPTGAGGTIKRSEVVTALQKQLNTLADDQGQNSAKIVIGKTDAVSIKAGGTGTKTTFIVAFKDKGNEKATGTIELTLDLSSNIGSHPVTFQ